MNKSIWQKSTINLKNSMCYVLYWVVWHCQIKYKTRVNVEYLFMNVHKCMDRIEPPLSEPCENQFGYLSGCDQRMIMCY